MKITTRIQRTLLVLMLVLVCTMCVRQPAQAATIVPVPKGLTVTAGERRAVLKWTKTTGVDGYRVLMREKSTGKTTQIALARSASTVTYTKNYLDVGKTYSFYLIGYKKVNGKTLFSAKSPEVTVTTKLIVPAKPTGKMYSTGDGKVTLSWNSIRYATGYVVYQRSSTGKYVKIAKLAGTKLTVQNLKNNHAYYFRVLAYRTVQGKTAKGQWSSAIKAMPQAMTDTLRDANIMSMNYDAVVNSSVTATRTDGKGSVTVPYGTKVTVTNLDSGTCTVKLNSTTSVYMSRGYLNLNGQVWNSGIKYSKEAAEQYVNYKGYKSSSKYLVWINLYTQRIYLFTGSQYDWKLAGTQPCATGLFSSRTRVGVNPIIGHQYYCLFSDNTCGYYLSWVNSGNAIHSWLYWVSGNSEADWNKVPGESYGRPVSHGCIRTAKSYAKYLYDTVPAGSTTNVIF